MTFSRGGRFWLGTWLALVVGTAANAASKDERWLRLTTPEFVVVTPLKEKEATTWTAEFAQYIAALRSFFDNKGRRLSPLTIVVFSRDRDFERYRPLGDDGKPQKVAGFFLQHESWAVAGLAGASVPDEVRRTIFHEGVHWFLAGAERPNPVWIEEGLAEVFSTFEIAKRQAEWGKAIPEHVALLRYQGLLPLERLIFTGRDELFGKDMSHTGMVYAQSWAFAHFLIFGQHSIPRSALGDYADLSASPIGLDEAFQRAFGKTYTEMDAMLRLYIRNGSYYINRRPLAEFTAPTAATATRAEVEEALGRLALGGRRWETAAQHARAVIASAPADPRGHEVLALALKESGDLRGAIEEFTLAVEHGTTDAQAFFELAIDEQNTSAGVLGEIATMGPEVARRIANRYERAINLNPRMKAAYQNLAGVIGIVEPWSEEDRKFLELGARIWPRDDMIQVGLAIVTRRGGETAQARAQLERVLAAASGDGGAARAFARRLAESWEQQDIVEKVNALGEAKKFSEALALVREQLERGVSAATRVQLVAMQRPLETAATGQRIEAALQGQQWVEARRLLVEVVSSDAPIALKAQAKRSLAELDRHRLGLEATRK